jgi:hypothetical protein
MPNLDVLPSSLSTAILTLGIALIAAGIVGGGFEAAGTKIPVIAGWRRQVGAAVFGLALVGFGWSALQAARWHDDYVALVNKVDAQPPPPADFVADNLNALATSAAENYTRNCAIANFISVHKVDVPLAVKRRLRKNGGSPALQCYLDLAEKSAEAVTVATRSKTREAHPTGAVSPVPTVSNGPERVLEALTQVGATGWIYLGRSDGQAEIKSERKVQELTPRVGATLKTITDEYLHDPAAQKPFSSSRVVGIIPKGSEVLVGDLALSGNSNEFTWARVTFTQGPIESPDAVVRTYYRLWDAQRLSEAYELLSDRYRQKNPYGDWAKSHEGVVHVSVQTSATSDPMTVSVLVRSTDRTANGTSDSEYQGTWKAVYENGATRLDQVTLNPAR